MKTKHLFLVIFFSSAYLQGQTNLFSGTGSGASITTGMYNVGFGHNTLNANAVGSNNSAIGYEVLKNATSSGNTGVGTLALTSNTSGASNSAFGFQALKFNTSGMSNVGIGSGSLFNNTTGNSNVSVGIESLNQNTISSNNTALGYKSLYYNDGDGNTALGSEALTQWHSAVQTNSYNIGIGIQSGLYALGNNNIFIGNRAGVSCVGSGNVILGRPAQNLAINNTIIFATETDGASPGAEYVRINGTGMGIGTGAIANKLDVEGGAAIGATYSGTTAAPANGLLVQGNVGIGTSAVGNRVVIRHGSNDSPTGYSGLRFINLNSLFTPSTTNTKFLSVNSAGDVVLQNLPASAGGGTTIAAGTNIVIGGSPGSGYTIAANPTLSVAGDQLSISGGNTVTLPSAVDTNTNIYNTDGNLTGDRIVHMVGNDLIFDTASGSKMYIGDATTTTAADFSGSYKLYVEQGIMTEKVKVAIKGSGDWADYVFNPDYKLMPLDELKSYVKENKHLPGVPSAETLVKTGIDVAQMQAKQMEKIEELTLYVISQQQRIEAQQKEIEVLKLRRSEVDELKVQVQILLKKEISSKN